MDTNRIELGDMVKVLIYNADSTLLFSTESMRVGTVAEAVKAAYIGSGLHQDSRDFVYCVVNMATGTEALYRINAGGHPVRVES